MNRLIVAIAIFAAAGLPSLGMQAQATDKPGMGQMKPGMGQMMHKDPEVMKQMMANPHHMLAMAYHDNLMTFSHKLMQMAQQGETVPRDFARTAVAEMRRSADELDKHRAEAMRGMPAGLKDKHLDVHKRMDQHLVSVKGHIRDLEQLTKQERIPSQDVMKHLKAMMEECEGMDCGMMGGSMGMHGHGHGHGHEGKGMRDCTGCPCEAMPQHGGSTPQMKEQMKDSK